MQSSDRWGAQDRPRLRPPQNRMRWFWCGCRQGICQDQRARQRLRAAQREHSNQVGQPRCNMYPLGLFHRAFYVAWQANRLEAPLSARSRCISRLLLPRVCVPNDRRCVLHLCDRIWLCRDRTLRQPYRNGRNHRLTPDGLELEELFRRPEHAPWDSCEQSAKGTLRPESTRITRQGWRSAA
jgi:hypothetical protein